MIKVMVRGRTKFTDETHFGMHARYEAKGETKARSVGKTGLYWKL